MLAFQIESIQLAQHAVSRGGHVVRITISSRHLGVFRACQIKERMDWWAVFSTNEYGEVWPYVTRGWTRQYDRVELEKLIPKIREISRVYLRTRPQGGRFFVNQSGAYFHETERGPYDQFVEFFIVDTVHRKTDKLRTDRNE